MQAQDIQLAQPRAKGAAAMSPADQMTPGDALNRLYQPDGRAGQAATKSVAAPAPVGIETKVDGDFNGWDGKTIVKLINGQIWKQAEYRYEYHYAYMPSVSVYANGGRFWMKVEGTSQAVAVERLR